MAIFAVLLRFHPFILRFLNEGGFFTGKPPSGKPKEGFNIVSFDVYVRKLHHSAHTATHSTAHRWHSLFVFLFINQNTFSSQEHTCN